MSYVSPRAAAMCASLLLCVLSCKSNSAPSHTSLPAEPVASAFGESEVKALLERDGLAPPGVVWTTHRVELDGEAPEELFIVRHCTAESCEEQMTGYIHHLNVYDVSDPAQPVAYEVKLPEGTIEQPNVQFVDITGGGVRSLIALRSMQNPVAHVMRVDGRTITGHAIMNASIGVDVLDVDGDGVAEVVRLGEDWPMFQFHASTARLRLYHASAEPPQKEEWSESMDSAWQEVEPRGSTGALAAYQAVLAAPSLDFERLAILLLVLHARGERPADVTAGLDHVLLTLKALERELATLPKQHTPETEARYIAAHVRRQIAMEVLGAWSAYTPGAQWALERLDSPDTLEGFHLVVRMLQRSEDETMRAALFARFEDALLRAPSIEALYDIYMSPLVVLSIASEDAVAYHARFVEEILKRAHDDPRAMKGLVSDIKRMVPNALLLELATRTADESVRARAVDELARAIHGHATEYNPPRMPLTTDGLAAFRELLLRYSVPSNPNAALYLSMLREYYPDLQLEPQIRALTAARLDSVLNSGKPEFGDYSAEHSHTIWLWFDIAHEQSDSEAKRWLSLTYSDGKPHQGMYSRLIESCSHVPGGDPDKTRDSYYAAAAARRARLMLPLDRALRLAALEPTGALLYVCLGGLDVEAHGVDEAWRERLVKMLLAREARAVRTGLISDWIQAASRLKSPALAARYKVLLKTQPEHRQRLLALLHAYEPAVYTPLLAEGVRTACQPLPDTASRGERNKLLAQCVRHAYLAYKTGAPELVELVGQIARDPTTPEAVCRELGYAMDLDVHQLCSRILD